MKSSLFELGASKSVKLNFARPVSRRREIAWACCEKAAPSWRSGRSDQVEGGSGGLGRGNSLGIAARELEMDLLHCHVLGRRRGCTLFGRPAAVINEIRFHTGHPPMAAGPNGNATARVAGPILIHISSNRPDTDSRRYVVD